MTDNDNKNILMGKELLESMPIITEMLKHCNDDTDLK